MQVALTGLEAIKNQMSAVSNNIANSNTNAFKSGQSTFSEIFGVNPLADQRSVAGRGVAQTSTSQKMDQGAIVQTDAALDMAIAGDALFVMGKLNAGENENTIIDKPFFSRNGALNLSLEGYITNAEGDVLLSDEKRPIRFPYTNNYKHVSQYTGSVNLSQIADRADTLSNSSLRFTTPYTDQDSLQLKVDNEIGIEDGDLSLVHGKVYYTEDGILHHVGSYDRTETGQIDFNFFDTSDIKSAQIYTYAPEHVYADFADTKVWTQVTDRYYDGITTINGRSVPDVDDTSPANAVDGDSVDDPQNFVDTNSFQISTDYTGRILNLDINSTSVSENFGIFKGPYVHTNEPLKFEEGAKIAFSYQLDKDTQDQADTLGFIVNRETGEATSFFNETIEGTSEWVDIEFTVPKSGSYDVVFSSGAFDSTGGAIVETKLNIKDFSMDILKPRKTFTPIDIGYETPSIIASKLEDRIGTGITLINTNTTFNAPSNIDLRSAWWNASDYVSFQDTFDLTETKTDLTTPTIHDFDSVSISFEGEVTINQRTENGFETVDLGTIGAIKYLSMGSLKYMGNGRYEPAVPQEQIMFGNIKSVDGGNILQGSLEKSNTNLMNELSDMIALQTQFQTASKTIQAYTDALNKLTDI